MIVDASVFEFREFNRKRRRSRAEHGNSVKIEITCITPVLHAFLDFFQVSLAFNMFSTLVLMSVSNRAKIGQNDYSDSYIESTTVFSDIICITLCYYYCIIKQ